MARPAFFILALAAWLSVVPPAAAAAPALQVTPGLWEFRVSIPDPSGQARPLVERTCIRDREMTPERAMARFPECRIADAVVDGRAARWKMRCQTPVGPMNGRGSLKTNGTEVVGTLELTFDVGIAQVPATSPFRGRRVGDCR